MSNCECGEIHLRYNGSIEWKGNKQPVILWRTVTCDSCGQSWIFIPEKENLDGMNLDFTDTTEEYESLAIKEGRRQKNKAFHYAIKETMKLHLFHYDEVKGVFYRILNEMKED